MVQLFLSDNITLSILYKKEFVEWQLSRKCAVT